MDDLKQAILEKAKDDDGKLKLPCALAFAIATEYDVSPREIGRICDEEDVRICNCQLGCF